MFILLAALLAARPFTPEELLQTRRPDDVQVSPDGRWASVTVRQKNLDENRDVKDIWLLSLQTSEAKQFTRNGRSEHARWSPDGKHLLVSRESQLWLYGLDGGDPRQITTLSTGADNGVFMQLTGGGGDDVPLPGEKFGFGVLCRAQAIGDFESLAKRNRRAISVNLGSDVEAGLKQLAETVKSVLAKV